MLLKKEEKRSVSITPGAQWVGKPVALARAKKLFYNGVSVVVIFYASECNY
jgi:hypothetical protein